MARALSSKAERTQLMRTNVPSIFTTADMDPDMGLSRFGAEAKTLFGPNARSEYLSPVEMNYKLPTNGAPEFAFVGRSNVGKSSLVDLLLGNRKIVRVSKEPGCTRSINYYGIAKSAADLSSKKDFSSYLVDLPGYGFAKKSKEEQQKWKGLIVSYLQERNQSVLRRAYVLVDSRRGIKDADVDMMDVLSESYIPFQVVFTKVDLVSEEELQGTLQDAFKVIQSAHGGACVPFVHTVSSTKNTGVDAFKLSIGEIYSHNWG
eukprot:CAMPEP_0173183076 /NCGR_PEP_ID=MMETSP1141-20130122/8196_1 /TAXON_ID=483371 /ORGANISM="non described non described, Strain CCMP2298" /LENGTH=260 /DNA_ID=CAMNT_0014106249 /DNA_START=214 /DNA_END=996 /DNA_ORIENTATION=+